MLSLKKIALLGASLAAMASVNVASAQITILPQVTKVNPTDLFQDIPGGVAYSTNYYTTAAAITSQSGYVKNVPLTAFSLTFANTQSWLELNPAGTLAAGTITLAPAPSDGARECIFSTQIVSALTLSANSGQSINNAVTALAANTGVCYLYSASNLTWDRD